MSTNINYLQQYKNSRTEMKVFLYSGAATTMLTGRISEFDDTSFVLDKCLIQIDKVISITPKG
jgi:sRNA-binding regulator protein Hfq